MISRYYKIAKEIASLPLTWPIMPYSVMMKYFFTGLIWLITDFLIFKLRFLNFLNMSCHFAVVAPVAFKFDSFAMYSVVLTWLVSVAVFVLLWCFHFSQLFFGIMWFKYCIFKKIHFFLVLFSRQSYCLLLWPLIKNNNYKR